MFVRITIFLLLASVSAFAQSTVSEEIFKRALNEELAKRENGAWLYSRSEVYRRSVLHSVSEKLHLGTANQSRTRNLLPQTIQKFVGDVSNDTFGQDETSVAISHNDPRRIVIGSNDEAEDIRSMPVYLSTDAGMSWNTSRLPSPPDPYVAYGDPSIVPDQFNGFYYAYMIYNDAAHLSNLLVAHSPDGVTWTYGNPVIHDKQPDATVEDKECIAVDMGNFSETFGRIYVTWIHSDNSNILKAGLELAWSDNSGFTWSTPVLIDSTADGFFPQLKIDNSGNVFYTYSRFTYNGSKAEHYLLISKDHGATFIRRKIADYYNYPFSQDQLNPTLKGEKGIRSFPYVSIELDRYNKNSDTLYAVYGSYNKWDKNLSTAVLYYTYTQDQGLSWADPYPIGFEGDSAALRTDRFMPWITVDDMKGDVHILYYSSENDPKNLKMQPFRVIFSKETPYTYQRLSDTLFDPLHVTNYTFVPFVGDYIGCAIQGGTYVYAWTENRKGLPTEQFLDGEIFAFVTSVASGVSELHQVSAKALSIYSAYPNPAGSGKLKLGFAIPKSGAVSLSLSTSTGSFVQNLFSDDMATGTYEKEFDISTVASGEYIVSLTSGNASVQKKIVVVH